MITYITDEIAIGNSSDARQITYKQFDATLNVAIDLDIEDGFKYRHKIGLLDGPGNDPLTFLAAVLMLHSLMRQNKRILVHCHEGKSRSVMITATYIASMGYTSLDDALKQIMAQRNVDIYRPALYDIAKETLPKLKEILGKQ